MALQGAAGELGDSGQAIQHLAQQKEGEISGRTCRRQDCCELGRRIAAVECQSCSACSEALALTVSMGLLNASRVALF